MSAYTTEYVKERLEQAGYALQRLPSVGPRGHKVNWPAIPRTGLEVWVLQVQAEADPDIKMALAAEALRFKQAATLEQMAALDDWLEWKTWLDNKHRNVLWMRMFRNPVTDRYWFSWPRIGKTMGYKARWVQELHKQALGEIAIKLHRNAA